MNARIAGGTSRLWWVVLFLAIGGALVVATLSGIRGVHYEIGDFAANSLLIQDAKHLTLLQGNYSRIGVHHPGPAILYVLAAGELLFHDWLHSVKSPLGGQLIAVALYTALWIVLIAHEFRKQTGSVTSALVGTGVFVLATALFDYNYLSGLWFPHLYYFPFAAFLVSLCRLADGYADSTPVTAFAAGFAINGHVSFVSTVAIMVGLVVVMNLVVVRRGPLERRVLGTLFFRRHARRLAAAAGIFMLFLVPLALQTLLHFPGPVPKYIAFSGANDAHTVHEAFNFMCIFWGGFASFLAGVVGLWLARRSVQVVPATVESATVAARARLTWVEAVIVVEIAATVALMIYAVYGIDLLQFTYTAFFYQSVPCLMIATMAVCAFDGNHARYRAWVAAGLALVCIVGVLWKVHRPSAYDDQYHSADLPVLVDAIRSHDHGGRIALDLDDRYDWGWLWLHLVGAEAYAKRRHEDLFCLRRNWHILFTEEARCRPDEAHAERYIVRVVPDGTVPSPAPAFLAQRIGFFRYDPPVLADAGRVDVLSHQQLFNDYIDESGWSPTEGEYVWSNENEARLSVRVGPNFDGVVTLDAGAFLPNEASRQRFLISSDEGAPSPYEFTLKKARQMIEVPAHTSGETDTVTLRIQIPDALSPREAKFGGDSRRLGISLFAIRVDARSAVR